jgi:NADPH-dependent curcumin reductase CurA
MTQTREIHLKSRPRGAPTHDNFELVSVDLKPPAAGEVQVRNLWMSVDPYMRGRMNEGASYAAPWALGEPCQGAALGEVTASAADGFEPGDLVLSNKGWREAFTAHASTVQKFDAMGLAPQTFLSVAGMTGLTAYAGLLEAAVMKDGDVVFVSGAAGAVGQVACQIAKAKGHKVIGSAGGPDKIAFLKEIGVDEAIDYKAEPDLSAALHRAAPRGIDVYFDNVGGDHLEAALNNASLHARFAICGRISSYNDAVQPPGPRNLSLLIARRIRLQGFLVGDHQHLQGPFIADLKGWIDQGKIKWRETVVEGLENAPDAFFGLFTGANTGKMLVKLA